MVQTESVLDVKTQDADALAARLRKGWEWMWAHWPEERDEWADARHLADVPDANLGGRPYLRQVPGESAEYRLYARWFNAWWALLAEWCGRGYGEREWMS